MRTHAAGTALLSTPWGARSLAGEGARAPTGTSYTSGMPHAGVTRLRLRVSPGAGQEGIVGRHGEAWKLRVRAAPENGRANEAVVRLLAEVLGIARESVALVSGHGSRDKLVELDGVELQDAERRLASFARKD